MYVRRRTGPLARRRAAPRQHPGRRASGPAVTPEADHPAVRRCPGGAAGPAGCRKRELLRFHSRGRLPAWRSGPARRRGPAPAAARRRPAGSALPLTLAKAAADRAAAVLPPTSRRAAPSRACRRLVGSGAFCSANAARQGRGDHAPSSPAAESPRPRLSFDNFARPHSLLTDQRRAPEEPPQACAMSYSKSVTNLTVTGAKVLIEAAEAKATEIVRLPRRCPKPARPLSS